MGQIFYSTTNLLRVLSIHYSGNGEWVKEATSGITYPSQDTERIEWVGQDIQLYWLCVRCYCVLLDSK